MFKWLKKFFRSLSKGLQKPTILNLYQYKFWRYKNARARFYPLNLSSIKFPMQRGLVSIVLPVYNGEDMVSDAIESVLLQTYRNFELIVIDDGSTDNTRQVLERYARRDNRVKLTFNEQNLKIPRTLSKGFRQARGEFLTWTSADNIMEDNFIEEMVRELHHNPNIGMIYGNMRLIDARGKIYRRHGWYEKPVNSGNVMLPDNTLELNTYPGNTIGAAFMYRAIVNRTIEDYSKYRHGIEDYDYWMRINSLFEVKHTSHAAPLYLYRWHDKSLTAQDKQIGITSNRYKLMVFEDARRDFYLSPLVWYIEADGTDSRMVQAATEFKDILTSAGHICVNKSEVDLMLFSGKTMCLCHVNFGKKPDIRQPQAENPFDGILKEVEKELSKYKNPVPRGEQLERVGDTKEFYLGDNKELTGELGIDVSVDDVFNQAQKKAENFDPFEGIFAPEEDNSQSDNQAEAYEFKIPKGTIQVFVSLDPMDDMEKLEQLNALNYDVYVSMNDAQELMSLNDYSGWFGITDMRALFPFLDAKIKNRILARMEDEIEGDKGFKKKVSVILCTHRKTPALIRSLLVLCDQTFPADDYEIVFVNNSYKDMRIAKVFEVFMTEYPHINLKYVSAPIPGLSYARNAGMWSAEGEYLLYIDDDAIPERNWIEEMYNCFNNHPEAGVIGGQVILVPPEPRPMELGEGLEVLWSELKLPFTQYHQCENYSEFPFGANFGVRARSLSRVGGFRTVYGRMGDNFAGGEETAVCFMMGQIGMTVGLNPSAKVYHHVDVSRYTFNHIEKTTMEGILTQYRLRLDLYAPQDWSDSYVEDRIKQADKELRSLAENTPEYVSKDAEKQGFLQVMGRLNEDYANREISYE